ncbi:DUF6920 family protein [Calothrix sp. 336/3]|uniref:DUF6920 family protein n=1 Tax=Calothrix sp. 336/3 TaxID=1337936 RepID=UPI000B2A14A4
MATQPTGIVFSPDVISQLPSPVQRYFLHAITPGTPLANSVKLDMAGSFKLGEKWVPMVASEILAKDGFVWKAHIGEGLLKFSGADYYKNGEGGVEFALWGMLPIARDSSPDAMRSATGRLAGELIWLPSVLLTLPDITWKAIDDNTIEANFHINHEPITLTLVIDSSGKPLKISFPRWGNQTEDGHYTYIPFGGEILAEREFNGLRIPSQLHMGWWFGSERYGEFFRCAIAGAKFS